MHAVFKSLAILFIASFLFSQEGSPYKTPSKKQLDSLKIESETLFKKDQTFRRIYMEAENKLGKDSFEMEYFWEVVEAQDKVLEKKLPPLSTNSVGLEFRK